MWQKALLSLGSIAVILGLTIGAARQASAETTEAFTAETLRDACESLVLAIRGIQPISQEDPGAMLCLGYIAGWTQAMEGVQNKPFCLPESATARPGDIADLIVTYIDGHPSVDSVAAHQAVLETLIDSFPCNPEALEDSSTDDEGAEQP